ncbi:glycosyltransferase family 4 protein [Cohnella faecalis]|nr:glycosyltransferase family 4 protein [Cohnella faecalis]
MKKTVEKLAYNRSDKFVVLSGYFQTVLEQEYGVASDRIHRIPGAVDTDRFRPADNRSKSEESWALRTAIGFSSAFGGSFEEWASIG